ncbi:uncharacterized protein LOC124927484 [Impatiens glandulifera]|uniref:uncharacterized protein LOC124927484 n=1 Tax=Impatiens glandulifera TaxID=253017 RepID=UPI001FB1555B|nr:uncharacterized protein LOC124927484 [Impatiens glandulifera]
MAPCSYGGTCEYGETCDGTTGIPSTYSQADDVTKTGTEIPSSYVQADDVTKTGTDPAASDTCIKHINEKGEETIGQVTETSRSKTDLSTVLEAWFSAGFHTGKYEAEQANIKKGQ